MERKIKGRFLDHHLTTEQAEHYARLAKRAEEEFGVGDVDSAQQAGPLTEELRQAIRDCGKTYAEIGLDAGVSALMIERFVNGERGIHLSVADKLAKALRLHLTVS